MAKIVRGGLAGALDRIEISQRDYRSQVSALTDAVRQLAGAAQIGPDLVVNDPLSAPYVLYVNPYIGSDTFVSGSYSTAGSATQRIELQRLECGYTQSRPFRTLNRAIIEAGIITAKSFYQAPIDNSDLVSIVLAPGAMDLLNGGGAIGVTQWENGKVPTDNELRAFNTAGHGGILLPRGCSVVAVSSDMRKTILRPTSVPAPADEASDLSNRRTIFKMTGGGYYWGLTFMDQGGNNSSHHLLHCFEFASQTELNEFYGKIQQAFAGANNTGGLDPDLLQAKPSEYEIVGPQPVSGAQTIETDTTKSASPYIFNCSIRSDYGLCGVLADGAKTTGFRSAVIAQFTGVSLQRDLSSWQRYDSISSPRWGSYFGSYADYVAADPDDVRMHPRRRSFHIRARNNAVIQEVSVFAIGQGIHHWSESGSDVTVTNSNSNFGGCAALAEGYKSAAFQADSGWNVGRIRVASNLADRQNNVRKIFLGTIDGSTANSAIAIKLTKALEAGSTNGNIPRTLDREGYSLPGGSYIWVENNRGKDYRAQLPVEGWSGSAPDTINVTTAFENEDGITPGQGIINSQGLDIGQDWPSLAGARIYVRRLQDVRSIDERRYSLRCNSSVSGVRTPVRDYVIETSPGSGGIVNQLGNDNVLTVAFSLNVSPESAGVLKSANVELRRANAGNNWAPNEIYRTGDVVSYNGKRYVCATKNSDASFTVSRWEEIYVHMEDDYAPEDYWKNSQPVVLFDSDTDSSDLTASCGYNKATVWSTDAAVKKQYRSAGDYRAIHSFLTELGFSANDAHTILLPRAITDRERNPVAALDGLPAPAGVANAWSNWPVEFRRPSNIRLFGHAWEWSGYLNYTKSLPSYQKELGSLNKFSYYFTNKDGGRVYGSGFNEEGFIVTPQGLQDLATGTEIAFESIADSDVPIDELVFPVFDNVNTLTINNQLNLLGTVTGNPIWEEGVLPLATTEAPGIVELATAAEALARSRSDLALTPASIDETINLLLAAINAVLPDQTGKAGQSLQTNGTTVLWAPGLSPGAIIYWPMSLVPTGWLKANGAAISRSVYSALFAVIGTTYGAGDGSTTFNVPDYRGEFLRAWDDGRGIDVSRALGSMQTQSYQSHDHPITDPGHVHSYSQSTTGGAQEDSPLDNFIYQQAANTTSAVTGITKTDFSGGTETRPRNVAVSVLIKY